MTTSQTEKNGWPVSLYRKTEMEWQKLQPRNARGQNAVVRATPQLNCIVLHRIQVRLRLGQDVQGKQETTSPSTRTRNSADKSSSLVVRRRDCILISSKHGARSLVLKFRDRKSCHEFSDLLIQLNPSLARTILAGTASHLDVTPSPMLAINRSNSSIEGALVHTAREDEQMRSILGRLLLSEDFHELVDSVEACLRRSNDGGALLAALANEWVAPILREDRSSKDGQA